MTTDLSRQMANSQEVAGKVSQLFQKRVQIAQDNYNERVKKAFGEHMTDLLARPMSPWDIWSNWSQYATDFAQRSVLFWDTLRQRGNNFVEHERAGKPPLLHFDHEMVMDARGFQRPVNYAMVRIVPPQGVVTDPKRRPYLIIDPRAGHGPGIGGFKDDSQVGEALREGHPVYFVIFFPQPEPGQTLLDVTAAEQRFVRKVRELHPDSPKPVIVGNCQGGWAAMMLVASDPDNTGPVLINGAPMSYWGGAWREGEGDNPMRYSGGLLGGTWLASLVADLGNGVFDGAWLVQNFENLNPANSFWDKYYNLYANIDTEPARFLEFERWWGGFYLLNKEEIEWIVQNLFVGNELWSGAVKGTTGGLLDLKQIKSPIVLFASMGDNITPPQQAFNWVADVYGSTDEIKARGQVIVGLMHENIGHLGIFVSGKVARKEYRELVSVLKSIEALPAGLYAMSIKESVGKDGKPEYEVEFQERRLEEIAGKLNRFRRADEKPFEAVAEVAEFNQRAYELFAQPLVQAMSNDYLAKLQREFHPLRFEKWAVSDLNPWMRWIDPAADMVRAQRQAAEADQPFRKAEGMVSELVSASLDYYRATRDAISEALFFLTYGNLFSLYVADKHQGAARAPAAAEDPRELPVVREALAAIAEGGYAEAVARTGYLLSRQGASMSLDLLEMRQEMLEEYRDLLPDLAPDQRRRIRGEQEIICRYEPEQAIETLPKLLANRVDRKRFLTLAGKLFSDTRVVQNVSAEQRRMFERIRGVLSAAGDGPPRLTPVKKAS